MRGKRNEKTDITMYRNVLADVRSESTAGDTCRLAARSGFAGLLATPIALQLFTVRSREDFEKGIENWKHQGNNGLSDLQMALKLQQWIATFGDLHTNLNFVPLLDRNRLLPLGLKWMDDGLYIVTAPVGKEGMLGCRLMELNGTPIEVVADSLGTLFSADNEAVRKSMVPNYLCFVQLLEHFGFVPDGKVMFKLASADGNMQLHELTPGSVNPQNLVSFRPEGVALCYRNARTLFLYIMKQQIVCFMFNITSAGAGSWKKNMVIGNRLPDCLRCRTGRQCVRYTPSSAGQ